MILTEHPYKGNKKLIRTYTDDPTKIIVPVGTGATYKAASVWSNYASIIEEATV